MRRVSGGQETECREVVNCFVVWCGNNHLHLNVAKTKEMVVDFRRTRTKLNTISILGEVEVVEGYRCLGVQLDNRLGWKFNTEALYRKRQSRRFFLRKLKSFNVCSKMLHIFYQSVVFSAIFFAAIC